MSRTSEREKLSYKFSYNVGKALIAFIEWTMKPFIDDKQSFDESDFYWIREIEEYYPQILEEYKNADVNKTEDIYKISEEQQDVVEENKWFFLPLYLYGVPIEKNLKLCPYTASALQIIPDVTTAFFSTLSPGTYIEEHRGAFKGYLRYHLGVIVPKDSGNEDACAIRINNKIYHWQEGKSLVFDDTYLHDAWNDCDQARVVLYVDFIRPMPFFYRWLTRALTYVISKSLYVKNMIKRMKQKSY